MVSEVLVRVSSSLRNVSTGEVMEAGSDGSPSVGRLLLSLASLLQTCLETVAARRRGNTSDAALVHGFLAEVAKVARWTVGTHSLLQVCGCCLSILPQLLHMLFLSLQHCCACCYPVSLSCDGCLPVASHTRPYLSPCVLVGSLLAGPSFCGICIHVCAPGWARRSCS